MYSQAMKLRVRLDGKVLHLVEQPPQRRPVAARLAAHAGAVDQVRLLEGRQRVQLQSLAGEEDVEDLAALEADLVARRRVGQRGPVAAVALELREGRRHARRAEHVAQRQRLERVDHVAELLAAGAAQVPVGADRADVPAPPALVLRLRDPLRRSPRFERPVDGPAGRRAAWPPGPPRRSRRLPRRAPAAARSRPSRARSGHSRGRRACRPRRSPDPRAPAPRRAPCAAAASASVLLMRPILTTTSMVAKGCAAAGKLHGFAHLVAKRPARPGAQAALFCASCAVSRSSCCCSARWGSPHAVAAGMTARASRTCSTGRSRRRSTAPTSSWTPRSS